MSDKPIGWAAWHPRHGFEVPREYEGAIAFADLDAAVAKVRDLNRDDSTNNRTGWRAVKVALVKVPA
jgi:hypothetical protein